MKLREKTLLTIGVTVVSLIGILYITSSTILLKGFDQLHKREAYRNVQRVQDAFSNYLSEFSVLNEQWAMWDDTYNFIKDGNRRYIERNLNDISLRSLRSDLILFINSSGQLVFSQSFNLKQRKAIPTPKEIQAYLAANTSLLQNAKRLDHYVGIVLLPQGPMAIAARPILTSGGKGPSRGTLILGRYLNTEKIKALSELTHLPISMYLASDPQLPPDFKSVRPALSKMPDKSSSILVRSLSNGGMVGYTLLRDIDGKPVMLLRVDMPKEFYQQSQLLLTYLVVSLGISTLVVGIAFTGATLFLLEKLLLSRLAYLSTEVRSIGTKGDLSMRVLIAGRDELSLLARTINWMLETLESSLKELKAEQKKAERLLHNILPQAIADRLQKEQHTIIADNFAEVTVLFADIVGFTQLAAHTSPVELVNLLNQIFSAFDQLAEQHGLEKIKTIGDAYMVVGGLPILRTDHAEAIAEMALDMQKAIDRFNAVNGEEFNIRIGINTGPVVAGVIGLKKFIYDLWGDTVNTASRMESHGVTGSIQVTAATYQLLQDKYQWKERGAIQVKGKGEMMTYLLIGRKKEKLLV
ncbi:adenylate/guanylate cyclase domain-containing protein [Coleofasciculus sp. FACHB-129]|uniref:adenylate/guanylate cyclase domain-containing protein n=1 Tax=Cyanophyceae TaxID=3028117 RepID=UPI0016882C0A|nr:adenylate/guanylate cyclase domain-containing protein [Coleofasciculus sp. FACHB-129]MBD1897184.1 HAMP domain-containing protein [Coleofasciculus sp. FACHB-129]